ncbi:MAG: PIN domain-containing protein [Anaerolineae bacterium]
MNIIVDTCIWSLALRRSAPPESPVVAELRTLIADQRVQLLGSIRQELLSGVRDERQFALLRDHLAAFPDLHLGEQVYVQAAACFNACRVKGIQGSNTDFLICAAAIEHSLSIFTTDLDFSRFAEVLPIRLVELPRRAEG